MRSKIMIFVIVVLAIVFAAWFLSGEPANDAPKAGEYKSEKFGIGFSVPKGYFIAHEIDEGSGERARYSIVLMEDTEENRSLAAGKQPGRDDPPTITVGLFQNNLDHYTTQQFIEGTSFSNFKLSYGGISETSVAGEPALRYKATGLYENDNIVVARPNFVYMFTVFFNSPSDPIVSGFEEMMKTARFISELPLRQ